MPCSPGVKQPESEADHLLPSSAKVKNCGTVPLLSHKSIWPDA
jgi:hypothetical protein